MMKERLVSTIGLVTVLIAAAGLLTTPHGSAAAASPSAAVLDDSHDVVYMNDGRVLTGKIVSETSETITFRYIDPNIRIESRLTLRKADILNIERDVPVRVKKEETPAATSIPRTETRTERRARGLAEGDAADSSLPSLYVIPMKGQMGTDIRLDVYSNVIEDIRLRRPDAVVWVLECTDIDDSLLAPMMAMMDPNVQDERGLMELVDEYRILVQRLHDELRGIRQVIWVHDAVGVGSVMALAWPEMYMTPSARLIGMHQFFQEFGGDEDIKAKMREAWFAVGQGFLVRGGHAAELGFGLMNPRVYLSASWEGRKVIWRNDLDGEVIVNNRDDAVAAFRAKTAEDFGISRGTVDNLDDLAMLLGFREYRVIEGDALQAVNRYRTEWRRELENVWQKFRDYQQHMGWAGGDQAVMWLGRALQDLQFIVDRMRRYPAIEIRARRRGYPDRLTLEMTIERMQHDLAELRRQNTGRGGRGGRGGGGGGGMGGGGGG